MRDEEIDYKGLLQKYIAYVRDVEGVDYISAGDQRYASDVSFSKEEWGILEELAGSLSETVSDIRG